MLTALKAFLSLSVVPALYFGGIAAGIYALFRDPKWAMLLLVAVSPQPNIWYKVHEYPMGHSFLDFLFVTVLIGLVFRTKVTEKTPSSIVIFIFLAISYFALWNTSLRFSMPPPLTTANDALADWKNYAEMIVLYFLSLHCFREEKDRKDAVFLILIVMLFIAVRSYSNFSAGSAFDWFKREVGPFEPVHLGPNEFGAFMVDYSIVFLGLSFYESQRWKYLLCVFTFLFSLYAILYSYSRGAYLAGLGALVLFGTLKKRIILIAVFLLMMSYQVVLPSSVVDRIDMTYSEQGQLEESAEGRLVLWELAFKLFRENPVFGVGFEGFSRTVAGMELRTGWKMLPNQDVHSYYMKILAEQGVIGIGIFVVLLMKAFLSGWSLFSRGQFDFEKGLGIGFMGCVLSIAITSLFGDRWTHYVVGCYFWVLWGIVDRGILMIRERETVRNIGKI